MTNKFQEPALESSDKRRALGWILSMSLEWLKGVDGKSCRDQPDLIADISRIAAMLNNIPGALYGNQQLQWFSLSELYDTAAGHAEAGGVMGGFAEFVCTVIEAASSDADLPYPVALWSLKD